MRLTALLFALLPALALADPAPAPATAPLPGVYKAYVAPTRVPTPAPAGNTISITRIELHKDTMSLDLKGGAAVPMGDMAKNNVAGYSAGGELVYGASKLVDGALFVNYSSMPYKLTTSSKPHTSLGVGIKAVVKLVDMGKLGVQLTGGLGYFMENVATSPYIGNDPVTGVPMYETAYKSAAGMGFELGLGAGIQFTPSFALGIQAEAMQVSLSGGTGDSPLYLLPTLNLKYTF